jgi:hypothetical protein
MGAAKPAMLHSQMMQQQLILQVTDALPPFLHCVSNNQLTLFQALSQQMSNMRPGLFPGMMGQQP